jgi:hypothetical protein
LLEEERDYIEKLLAMEGRRSFRAKGCWRNAQRLILRDHCEEKRLRYWEGLMDGSIPHAWLTINGKVIDVTQEAVRRKCKRDGIEATSAPPDYFGISMGRRVVLRHVLQTGEWGPIIEEADLWRFLWGN